MDYVAVSGSVSRRTVDPRWLALGAALSLGLAACGDDENGTSDTGITTASSTEGATSGATTESMTTAGPETGSTTGGGETTTDGDTTTSETAATEPIMTTDATTEDPTGTTTGDPADCEAPGILEVCDQGLDGAETDHAFWAIGVDCSDPDPEDLSGVIPIFNKKFKKFSQWNNPESWRVAAGFGTHEEQGELLFSPREGERLLIISTGRISEPDGDGVVTELPGSQFNNNNNLNDDLDALPPPLNPEHGSNGGQGGDPFVNCDGVGDCSDSLLENWIQGEESPRDVLSYAFDVQVPGGTNSFGFDFVFFSSEYPDFVGEAFNDMFIAWSTSELFTGNVSFFDGKPLTVTSLATAIDSGYSGNAPELAGTGFEGYGATKWVTVNAPVAPDEVFTFALAIMDMGDSNKATAAIVDNWHWGCKECEPFEINPDCGTGDNPPCCGICIDKELDPECSTEGHPLCCLD
ncbi:MAG: choice-of-anchor L domain-containing protein [Myxococcales bacterium]|nr:choice-of-anchor L domain-containing protein [Myxococcales bacterium]